MDAHQERVLQSLRRVESWFGVNPEYVAANPKLGTQVDVLSGIVSRVSDHAVAQETQHAQSLLISKDEIEKRRELVVYHMAPIAKVARALHGTVAGIGVLKMPKWNISTAEVIVAATAMAQKAELYKDVLVENGLPTDFIEQLQQASATLKASIDGRGLARAARVAATQGVGTELALGRRTVLIIDAIVTRQIRSEPAKLAEWEQLKRVTIKSGPSQGSGGGVDTGSTPTQTSPAAVVGGSASVVKAA